MNRRFLAVIAVHLVNQLRVEEARLRQSNPEGLTLQLTMNHALAQSLRELMLDADLGLDVTAGLRAFLGAWAGQRRPAEPILRAGWCGWH